MQTMKKSMTRGIGNGVRHLAWLLAFGLCALPALMGSISAVAESTPRPQPRFSSPDEATQALVEAVRAHNIGRIIAILGPQGRKLVVSGDPVQDRHGREIFVVAYDQFHEIDMVSADRATLIAGTEHWPFPIPLVLQQDGWRFDADSGVKEILDRRIGRNELSVIGVCRAYFAAQREYAARDWAANGRHEFARKFLSATGKKDGLYWPAQAGEEESPLGPLVAKARAEGYGGDAQGRTRAPYHGYRYKILTQQGESAQGGELKYIVDGHMTRGFAMVAFPAKYGDSGIMTFIVNQDGIIYQKDLGAKTGTLARGMSAFDPGIGWRAVEPK